MALGRAMPTVAALDRFKNVNIKEMGRNGLKSGHSQYLQG